MAHCNQKKNINMLAFSLRTRNRQVELVEDYINITYGILKQVLNDEDISVMQMIPNVWLLYSEKVKMILPTSSKNQIMFEKISHT